MFVVGGNVGRVNKSWQVVVVVVVEVDVLLAQ